MNEVPATGRQANGLGRGSHDSLRLVDVVLELSAARSLAQVQDIVRRAARSISGADGATFILRDGDKCHYADEDAIAPLWKGLRFPMSACVSGWSMLHREAVVIEDIYADARVPHEAYRPTFVKSLVMVPIRTARPLGAIGVYWSVVRRATAEEVRALQALADSTAIAIENITLVDELRAARDAAEGANRLKDQFLNMLSHELRTPMTPIVAWADTLCDTAMTPAEIREAATAIRSCAASHLGQIDDLLDLAQLLAGSLRLESASHDLVAIVDDVVARAASDATAKGVAIHRAPTSGPLLVRADRRRLQQALGHLVANGVKFTPDGGSVRLELHAETNHVRVVVRDGGAGIPIEFVPHVFERFRQADASLTRTAGGMGIGLAIVRELVALHGGTVAAASPGAGQGSVFTVTLPRLSSPS